jgi:hypothetical protein
VKGPAFLLELKKHDFYTYERFLWKKIDLNLQNFRKNLKSSDFLQRVTKDSQNIKGFFKFLISYLVCSQIWLNLLMDNLQVTSQKWGKPKLKNPQKHPFNHNIIT